MASNFIQQVNQEESKLNSIKIQTSTFQCSNTYKPSCNSFEKSVFDNEFLNFISEIDDNDDSLQRLKQKRDRLKEWRIKYFSFKTKSNISEEQESIEKSEKNIDLLKYHDILHKNGLIFSQHLTLSLPDFDSNLATILDLIQFPSQNSQKVTCIEEIVEEQQKSCFVTENSE